MGDWRCSRTEGSKFSAAGLRARRWLQPVRASGLAALLLLAAGSAAAFTVEIDASDFGLNPTFSSVRSFDFWIEVKGPLAAGAYLDPPLEGVDYNVSGKLSMTPSGFSSFNLMRTIEGDEYYQQGSSLDFQISASADLSDGLQVSELVGVEGVFVFDGREVGTGRYHPALLELNADGTGLLRNSNNMGGINPVTMQEVDVEIGEEYVTELSFDPAALTIAVPEPANDLLRGAALVALVFLRRFLHLHA
jgi:hypothetical protein